ncbi:hypothetical protein FBY33_2069 [Arthrobacter sp. SLBN-112]|uniref:hypothetical protein n=1 Tax=Arthrobacter sp. SLBN-112 TaxID=2768452 RepID=UPI001153F077|nr:hypothetical protein [Arthrobacter sp. SLBN-112]TQJ40029.1 hypothetical protein FBY33_2069 [Arthrobacter sp. SLBN-112]
MSRGAISGMPWLPAACFVIFLPCTMVVCLDLYPGKPFSGHLSSAAVLLAAGIVLVLEPSSALTLPVSIPKEHQDQLKYAIRSGILPLASLFSDWRDELAQYERTYSLALRALPAVTAAVTLVDVYGVLHDPAGGLFFLCCAVATAILGVAVLAFSAVRLRNIYVVEGKLREQILLLDTHP